MAPNGGNMHWGHSISKDLMHWEHLAPAIARDTLGHIFSGSSIVDQENTAGYGEGSILAFYTSASDKNARFNVWPTVMTTVAPLRNMKIILSCVLRMD